MQVIPILENRKPFTTFYFYTDFIKKVAEFYKKTNNTETIHFNLIQENDFEASFCIYYFDPISIPVFLSLCEQLKSYHGQSLSLYLSNNVGVNQVLEFLYRADFFYLAGNNINPNYPIGKNIFSFDERYLGNFQGNIQRAAHKVRSYSIPEDNLNGIVYSSISDEDKRDEVNEYYTLKVQKQFSDLLFENSNTEKLQSFFVEVLAELITNGVLHSKSNVYALMFLDRYKTKFSISDNGIGLFNSLNDKKDCFYYKKFEFSIEFLKAKNIKLNVDENIKNNLFAIFETLYYSMLKNRKGLFDLMCNVVLRCNGYFRLHNENSQIVISQRMANDLLKLFELRNEVLDIHYKFLFENNDQKYQTDLKNIILKLKEHYKEFVFNTIEKYNNDIKFSSIRFYEVKFKGVHIEVEIPNSN
ncbi:MAG: hypothetical protein ACOYBS_02800 [Flavobacterium sp.]